jgi:2-oxoglutarate ferredoxin oxidoreductase subunit gamma
MTREIIIAGFGGQGVVSSGIILAYAGLLENRHVTFFPMVLKCVAAQLTALW